MRTVLAIWIFTALTSIPFRGFTGDVEAVPKVVFLAPTSPSPETGGLYRAIRAQLSGASLTLERASSPNQAERTQAVPDVAKELGAAAVFWIEEGTPYRLRFFIPSEKEGRYYVRTLDINPTTDAGLSEVIGIAVAVAVEDILVTRRQEITVAQNLTQKPTEPPPPPPAPVAPPPKVRRIELSAAYAGRHFASDTFSHGAGLGVGFSPISPLIVGIRFRITYPVTFNSDLLRLTVLSMPLSAGVAGRIRVGNADLRLGLAYTVDLRSFSIDNVDVAVEQYSKNFVAVHHISPTLSINWIFQNRLGLFGEAGVDLALKEYDFEVRTGEVETEDVASPLSVKVSVQAGLIVFI